MRNINKSSGLLAACMVAIAGIAAVNSTHAVSRDAEIVRHLLEGAPVWKELLASVRPVFEGETQGAVEFEVLKLNVWNDWAFGCVELRRPNGAAIDWRRTKYLAKIKDGDFQAGPAYFLLRRLGATWAFMEIAIGQDAVVVDGWRQTYSLPQDLISTQRR